MLAYVGEGYVFVGSNQTTKRVIHHPNKAQLTLGVPTTHPSQT